MIVRPLLVVGATLLGMRLASAQPQSPAIVDPPAPLAQLKDDKALAEALNAITQDPAIPVTDSKVRDLAQALMTEGVKQLQKKNFDQALANFLEAYGKFPSPKILLNIASTLRDMGRSAEAANTYQRYLSDPMTGAERVAEVKELLLKLDEQLTILTVRVLPRGSEISIDGGPFIAVGSSLVTRVRPGIHMIRIQRGTATGEVSVNGFEGENKEVSATLKIAVDEPKPDPAKPPPPVEEVHHAWMESDYHFTRDTKNPNARGYKQTAEAQPLPPLLLTPHDDSPMPDLEVEYPDTNAISSGVVAVLRIDGKGRGFAGGVGIAIARDRLEGEAIVLRSDITGGYLGARFRILTGSIRPYVAGGVPVFVFDQPVMNAMGDTTSSTMTVAVGLRAAVGLELMINGHLSVQGDLGAEHFFNVSNTRYEANAFVPTLGVIGRL